MDDRRSRHGWINIEKMDQVLEDVQFDESESARWHRIQVRSPLETTLRGMTRATATYPIRMESGSVNAVVLDEDPAVRCSTLLVAYIAEMNSVNNSCKLRQTTLFNKIKGIVSLCLLIFAPQVELRCCAFI